MPAQRAGQREEAGLIRKLLEEHEGGDTKKAVEQLTDMLACRSRQARGDEADHVVQRGHRRIVFFVERDLVVVLDGDHQGQSLDRVERLGEISAGHSLGQVKLSHDESGDLLAECGQVSAWCFRLRARASGRVREPQGCAF